MSPIMLLTSNNLLNCIGIDESKDDSEAASSYLHVVGC